MTGWLGRRHTGWKVTLDWLEVPSGVIGRARGAGICPSGKRNIARHTISLLSPKSSSTPHEALGRLTERSGANRGSITLYRPCSSPGLGHCGFTHAVALWTARAHVSVNGRIPATAHNTFALLVLRGCQTVSEWLIVGLPSPLQVERFRRRRVDDSSTFCRPRGSCSCAGISVY